MDTNPSYLDLYDYRQRVFAMYRERNEALQERAEAVGAAQRWREERDKLFAHHPQSALDEKARRGFHGLRYFRYDPEYCVRASLKLDSESPLVSMGTSGEHEMPMRRVGTLSFDVAGQSATLALYWIDVYGGGLFLPFRDATAPAETYGGGRYLFDTVKGSNFLWAPGEEGRTMLLEFNYAYNPSCSYDYRWNCPLAPRENDLPFPVPAGEMKFESPA